jgi:hypothetical protein
MDFDQTIYIEYMCIKKILIQTYEIYITLLIESMLMSFLSFFSS